MDVKHRPYRDFREEINNMIGSVGPNFNSSNHVFSLYDAHYKRIFTTLSNDEGISRQDVVQKMLMLNKHQVRMDTPGTLAFGITRQMQGV